MKKLLIADDEPDVRKTLALVFAKAYEIVEACDGAEAVRVADEEKPDLVLLDVMMPEMTGIQVLEALKLTRANLPIIMLTGEQDLDTAKRTLDHGATMYVTKPYDPKYLRQQVDRLLTTEGEEGNDKPWRIA